MLPVMKCNTLHGDLNPSSATGLYVEMKCTCCRIAVIRVSRPVQCLMCQCVLGILLRHCVPVTVDVNVLAIYSVVVVCVIALLRSFCLSCCLCTAMCYGTMFVRLSARVSVTSRCSIETARNIIVQTTQQDSLGF